MVKNMHLKSHEIAFETTLICNTRYTPAKQCIIKLSHTKKKIKLSQTCMQLVRGERKK